MCRGASPLTRARCLLRRETRKYTCEGGVVSYERKGDGKTSQFAPDRCWEDGKKVTLTPQFRGDTAACKAAVAANKVQLNEAKLKIFVQQGKLSASGARVAPQQRTWRRDSSGQRGC